MKLTKAVFSEGPSIVAELFLGGKAFRTRHEAAHTLHNLLTRREQQSVEKRVRTCIALDLRDSCGLKLTALAGLGKVAFNTLKRGEEVWKPSGRVRRIVRARLERSSAFRELRRQKGSL